MSPELIKLAIQNHRPYSINLGEQQIALDESMGGQYNFEIVWKKDGDDGIKSRRWNDRDGGSDWRPVEGSWSEFMAMFPLNFDYCVRRTYQAQSGGGQMRRFLEGLKADSDRTLMLAGKHEVSSIMSFLGIEKSNLEYEANVAFLLEVCSK